MAGLDKARTSGDATKVEDSLVRNTLIGRYAADVKVARAWGESGLDWAKREFDKDFVKDLADRARDIENKRHKLETINLILLVALFLYLQGIKFKFKLLDVDVEQFP